MTDVQVRTVAEQRAMGTMVVGCKILAQGNHDDMNQGQISVRVGQSDRMLIKSAVTSFAMAGETDMIIVPIDPLDQLPRMTPPEIGLHQAIYEARSDVGAIVHSHSPWTLLFGAMDLPIRPISHDGAWFVDETSVFTETSNTILNIELGRSVAKTLGLGRAVFLRNHGGVIVGTSIREAVVGAVVLERACELQLKAQSVGLAWHSSSDEDVKAKKEFVWEARSVRSYWETLAGQSSRQGS